MTPKRGIFQRSVSAFLALVMVFGLVAVHIPGLVTETAAAEAETLPSYHVNNRHRKDGLYIIRSKIADNLVMDIGSNASGTTESAYILDNASEDPSQRFVIQIDQVASGTALGYDSTQNTDSAMYGIRSVTSSLWMHSNAASEVRQRYNDDSKANYRDDYGRWQFIHNDDGTVCIVLASTAGTASPQYVYASGTAVGDYTLKTGDKPDGDLPNNYKWVLEQTHMQDDFFTTGIYWIETRLPDSAGTAPTDTTLGEPKYVVSVDGSSNSSQIEAYKAAAAGTENATTGEITWTEPAEPYESQQFVIQKISGGFYSIVNVSTGCYLAVGTDGGIVNGRSSNQAPNPEERWIIYPATQTGNTTVISTGSAADSSSTVGRFRIISAADGRQITVQQTNDAKTALSGVTSTLAASAMENYKTQDWLLKDIRLDPNNVEKGDTQTTDSGVFADTFDTSSTVTLPIKIFDYAADGMLFEYAANDTPSAFSYYQIGEGKGNFIKNADDTYTNVGDGNGDYVIFRMGNNMGFSMMSQSNGGLNGTAWDQTQGGTAYVGNGSNSFGYNKYWCPYISELRLNASVADNSGLTYDKVVLDYVFKAQQPDGYKAAMIVDGGTMNTATAGVDLSVDTDMQAALGYIMYGEQTFGRATLGLLESGLETVNVGGKTYTLPRYRQEAVEYIAMVLQRSLEIRYQSGDGYLNYNYVDGETSFADLKSGLDLAALLRGDTKATPDVTSADAGYTGVLEFYDGTNSSEGEDTLTSNFTRYGSYTETKAKSTQLIGTWADVKDNIKTCMDAAYWMLNSIFLEGSYNDPQDRYNSLLLTKVTDQSGKTGYIFDSTFITNSSSEAGKSAVVYDSATGTIRNSSAAGKSYTYWGVNRSAATYPFTPVRTEGQDAEGNVIDADGDESNPKGYQNQTGTTYILDGGIHKSQSGTNEPEYTNANYNFVLQSNAYFVYHQDDQLFFDFEGDDDVYLFINGELVLDIGGAHTVTGTKMNLNDYVTWAHKTLETDPTNERAQKLALVEGNTYSFDFYYMERHGWGSNMRIFTNFQLASGQIEAAKSAEQNDAPLSYGSVVNEDEKVEYTFTLKNTGTANLVMPTFADADIGVTVGYEKGLIVEKKTDEADNVVGGNGITVFDKDGGTLEFSDLVFTYEHAGSGEPAQTYQFDSSDAMENWLTDILVIDRYVAGDGTYGVLTVGGIYYKLTDDQIAAGAFHNEVEVSAFVRNDGHSLTADQENGPKNEATGSLLYDSAEFSVFLLSRPLYYHWRGNELKITLADVWAQVQPAVKDEDNPLSDLVKPSITAITNVRLTDHTGADTVNGNIKLDSDFTIYANYTDKEDTGIQLIYLTIDYNYDTTDENGETVSATDTATIPVQIFVLDVSAGTIVLDYGLHVNLTLADLTVNDVVTVDGRKTAIDVLGVADMNGKPLYVSRDNWVEGDNINSIKFDSLDSSNGIWSIDSEAEGNEAYHGAFKVMEQSNLAQDDVVMTYTLKEFLEGRDSIYLAIRVREANYTPDAMGNTDIHNEVEMFKKITIMPANVMYYEDDFGSVKYDEAAQKTQRTDTEQHGKAQQSSQSEQYGHDGNAYGAYVKDENGNEFGSADVTMSGGTITEIAVNENTINEDMVVNAASFTFKGTGFELISRTNAVDSATVYVRVEYPDGVTVKNYPVITQFDHLSTTGSTDPETGTEIPDADEVYQVPVFRLTDLPYGSYEVTIFGVPTYEFDVENDFKATIKPTKLYIDGIRIYNPILTYDDDGNREPIAEYGDEDGAVFTELRTLIFGSKAAAIGLEWDENDSSKPVYSGTFGQHWSFTEDLNGWYDTFSGNLQQFAIAGPNNEVYVDGTKGNYAVVLYVKETKADTDPDTTDDTKGLLHIGVHDLHDGDFYGGGNNQESAICYWTEMGWSDEISIGMSGTEQYYPIDYRNCPKVGDYYCVVVQVSSGMVSFTNVKTVELEFGTLEHTDDDYIYRYYNGELQYASANVAEDERVWTAVDMPLTTSVLTMRSILQSNAQAPGGDHYNPDSGDSDMLWVAVVIGLFSVVCLIPMIRKGVRA